MFIKLGEGTILGVEATESYAPTVDPDVIQSFKKRAAELKLIAPKADDFLYFSAVMLHAAEASAINDDGSPKLTPSGEPVKVGWDKSNGTLKWVTNDPSIKPYKNANSDIFPEFALLQAYKKWVHKPLCIDHKSSSVDHVRGFIVDTYYDRTLKRVIGLCALDKANYPDLARKVSTGYSHSVSMGTAVGAAICTDCSRVARVESDFCDHMRYKKGYGEINTELSPLELSIVVNGADPKAHIKEIIASANTLNAYVEVKTEELKKLAEKKFTANICLSDAEATLEDPSFKQVAIDVSASDIDSFKKEVEAAFEKLEEIVKETKNSEKDTNDLVSNQSSGAIAMDDEETPNTISELAPPVARYASLEMESIKELKEISASIESKLLFIKQSLDKLSKSTNIQEENMSSKEINKKGYFQGTEEPTPGQAKYEKDPLNEQARQTDKHMVGQSPFPEVGDVEGLHPSPSSAEPASELERKKMLARAVSEERAMRRQAIVNLAKKAIEDKKAYFNNGDDKNPGAPTPGERKYQVDKLNEDARKTDKHMVGQKPFPEVGDVEGLHPSPESAEPADELKRKEMLRRANTLNGKFVRASKSDGTRDLDNSTWEIRLGDKLLLSASVKDLSGGRSEMMYDSINTPEFGQRLLEKVKVYGADKVKLMVKSADTVAPPPDAAPASVPEAPVAVPEVATEATDTGKDGDNKESALEMATKVRDISSDLVEAVRKLTGEQSEMGAAEPMAAAASDFSTNHMNALRREINSSLIDEMKKTIASLNESAQELEMIASMYDQNSVTTDNADFVNSVVDDAMNEAKTAVAGGFRLMNAFVKYARSTEALVKRAEIESELAALAEGDTMEAHDDLMSLIDSADADLNSVKEMFGPEEGDEDLDRELDDEDPLAGLLEESEFDMSHDSDYVDDNDLQAKPSELKDLDVKPGAKIDVVAGFDTRASRSALRAKLAAQALGKQDDGQLIDMSKAQFSKMLDDAHKLVDVESKEELAKVETVNEVNKAMMDIVKATPKVKREAEAINKLISEGHLDPADLDSLVSEGLDKDAVAYYKKYYGQVEGGGEFASELVKEHVKAQMEAELNSFKVKMARAYELTYDMVDRGLVAHDRSVISANVDELMGFSDANFDTLKKVVAKHAPIFRKDASVKLPQVGQFGSEGVQSSEVDDFTLLQAALSQTPRRMF